MRKELMSMQCFTPSWFPSNVVWIDACSSTIPGSYKHCLLMFKVNKGWKWNDLKHLNANHRGPKTGLTRTWAGTSVNRIIILSRWLRAQWEELGRVLGGLGDLRLCYQVFGGAQTF